MQMSIFACLDTSGAYDDSNFLTRYSLASLGEAEAVCSKNIFIKGDETVTFSFLCNKSYIVTEVLDVGTFGNLTNFLNEPEMLHHVNKDCTLHNSETKELKKHINLDRMQ